MPPHTGLIRYLAQTLQYNPDLIERDDYDDDELQPPGTLPFDFYDRHLSPELSLARVVIQSSIPSLLLKTLDTTLEKMHAPGVVSVPFTLETSGDFGAPNWHEQIESTSLADSLATRYQFTLGNVGPPLVSRWAIHPTASKYHSTLHYAYCPEDSPDSKQHLFLSYSLRFRLFKNIHPEVVSSISDQLEDALKKLELKSLIIYQFYSTSPSMDQIFKDMDLLAGDLPSAAYSTGGLHEAKMEVQPPCDAKSPPWTIPPCTLKNSQYSTTQPIGKRVVPRLDEEHTDHLQFRTAAGICHHAWRRAIIEDATIIVLHCGNYERIGIRHRKTQTLILSNLIEVSKCQDPTYGQLHLGLMLTAVQDALDRHSQSYKPILSKSQPKRKASTDPTEIRRSKRQRAKAQTIASTKPSVKDDKMFWTAFTKCSIALVRLNFDSHSSPSPAPCLQLGGSLSPFGIKPGTKSWKKSYNPRECCTLTLVSNVGEGGTGRIHAAKLETRMADGTSQLKDVVVKVAVDSRMRNRVRREYNTYRKLWASNVGRIPMVYGLFEDIDDMATLLVLEKFEISFRDREPSDSQDEGRLLSVSRAERSVCLDTLQAMHKAGIAHLDIRAENIMVGHDGLPIIIDFDHSWVGAPESVMDREIEHCRSLLDGRTKDQFPVGVESPCQVVVE